MELSTNVARLLLCGGDLPLTFASSGSSCVHWVLKRANSSPIQICAFLSPESLVSLRPVAVRRKSVATRDSVPATVKDDVTIASRERTRRNSGSKAMLKEGKKRRGSRGGDSKSPKRRGSGSSTPLSRLLSAVGGSGTPRGTPSLGSPREEEEMMKQKKGGKDAASASSPAKTAAKPSSPKAPDAAEVAHGRARRKTLLLASRGIAPPQPPPPPPRPPFDAGEEADGDALDLSIADGSLSLDNAVSVSVKKSKRSSLPSLATLLRLSPKPSALQQPDFPSPPPLILEAANEGAHGATEDTEKSAQALAEEVRQMGFGGTRGGTVIPSDDMFSDEAYDERARSPPPSLGKGDGRTNLVNVLEVRYARALEFGGRLRYVMMFLSVLIHYSSSNVDSLPLSLNDTHSHTHIPLVPGTHDGNADAEQRES